MGDIDRRQMIIGGVAAMTLLQSMPAWARMANDGHAFHEPFASIIKKLLASLPYIEEGTGADILYVRTSDICAACQVMSRDYPGAIPGFRTRYYLPRFPKTNDRLLAHALRLRTPASFHKFMHGGAITENYAYSKSEASLMYNTNAIDRKIESNTISVDGTNDYGTPIFHMIRENKLYSNYGYSTGTIDKLRQI